MQLCGTSISSESLRAVGMEPQIRSVLCKSTTLKKRSPNPMNRFCISCTMGPNVASCARSCSSFLPHRAAASSEMIFDRLRVNAVRQHPAFVVIGAQTQLLLFIGAHHPYIHSLSSVSDGVSSSSLCFAALSSLLRILSPFLSRPPSFTTL